jgi:hypothetical protein
LPGPGTACSKLAQGRAPVWKFENLFLRNSCYIQRRW